MPSLSILLFIFSHCSWLVLQDKKTPIGQGTVKRDRFCAYFFAQQRRSLSILFLQSGMDSFKYVQRTAGVRTPDGRNS